MKFSADAGKLASALALAAALAQDKITKKIPVLGAVRLVTDGGAVTISLCNLDALLTLSIVAEVEEPGELAVSAEKLAALAAGFAKGATVAIAGEDRAAVVKSGRSRFRLSTFPVNELPTLAIAEETGRVELAREGLLALLSKPLFAASTEETRYYLNGILLHDTEDGLAAVATDGHRLAKALLPGAGGLSQDHRLIIPRPAIKVLLKLLGDKEIERLTLRRSATLVEIAAASFTFVSKLVDATYPDYQRLTPVPSGNTAIIGRAELARAIERIAAVAPETKAAPTVGLLWTAEEPGLLRLCIPGAPGLADDPIEAETSCRGRVAIQIRYIAELVDELGGDRVRIDAGDSAGSPILITDPDDGDFIVIQMPCVWGAEASQAA